MSDGLECSLCVIITPMQERCGSAGTAVQVMRGTGTTARKRLKGLGGMITATWLPVAAVGVWRIPAGGAAQTAAFIYYCGRLSQPRCPPAACSRPSSLGDLWPSARAPTHHLRPSHSAMPFYSAVPPPPINSTPPAWPYTAPGVFASSAVRAGGIIDNDEPLRDPSFPTPAWPL
ncbi:MAG: hypothetical protein ACYDHZ_01115 [Dehalococcoidia bacterium]